MSLREIDKELGSVISWIDPPAGSGRGGPLAGMRVGVKDNIDVSGAVSTCASRFFEHRAATNDADVVTRLLDAGALVIAKLNMADGVPGGLWVEESVRFA